MFKKIPEHIRAVVNDKCKRLVSQSVVIVVFFLIWLLLFTNNIAVFDTIVLSVVVALLISFITTLIEIFLKIYGNDEYRVIMHEYFKKECHFCNTSLTGIYPNRESAKLEDSLLKCANKAGERSVKIFTPNLATMTEEKYMAPLKKCASNGVKIEICTLFPELAAEFHNHRVTKSEGDKAKRLSNMKTSLSDFVTEFTDVGNVDIRICNLFPTMILFVVDTDCFLSFMFQGSYARDTLHMKFNLARESLESSETILKISPKRFVTHFDDIFEHPDTLKVTKENITDIIK